MTEEADVSAEITEEAVSTEAAVEATEIQGDQVEQTEEATPSTEVSEPQEDKPNGVQKRINELTRLRYEAERRAEEAEKQLQERLQQATQETYQSQKPRLEDYGYDQDAWVQAMENWAEQGIKHREQAQQEALQRQSQMERIREIQQKANKEAIKMAQKHPDYLAKINDPSIPNLGEINQAAQEALIDSDMMGELAYYLASNPAEVYQFASMSPVQAVKAIAKLEQKLAPATTKTTKAPPPIEPIEGKTEANVDPDKMSTDEWMKWRYSQLS